MALIRRIDPTTGEEYTEDVPEGAALPEQGFAPEEGPQALAPVGPQIGVPGAPGLPTVQAPEMPTSHPVREESPNFLERIGGPRPGQRMGGTMETLGQYATSDMGRNLIGALGVGLAGLRNTRDNGALQSQLLQMHIQGAGERAKENRQAAAMTDLWGAMTEASKMISANDLEGASKRLSALAKNRTIMGNPAAMGELLKLNAQLEARAGSKRALADLAGGPEIESGRDLIKRGGEVGLTLDEIGKVGPLLKRAEPKIISHFDNNTQSAVIINTTTGKVNVLKYGEGDLPTKLKDITDPDTRRALESKGIHIPTFIKAYNAKDPEAIAQLAAAASVPKPTTAQGPVSEKLARAKENYKADPSEVNKKALTIAQGAFDNEMDLAGGKRRSQLEQTREEARNQPVREALKAGGGIVSLKPGDNYKEVSSRFKNIGEAQDAEQRGEISIIPDRVGFEDVQKKKNSLSTLRDIREIGGRVFTKENIGSIGKQGVEAWVRGLSGTGQLGRDVRKLKVYQATVFDIAKGLGNDARISDADAKYAMQAMSTDTLFQAGQSFQENMDTVEKIFQRGLDRAARNERAPEGENLSGSATGGWVDVAPGVRMRKK